MNLRCRMLSWGMAFLLATAGGTTADEIEAPPGKGTISKALAKAKPGDVVKLTAGEYQDELRIPAGITLAGSGPDKTKLTGKGHALVQVAGKNVTIVGIELRPGEQMERGVNSDLPVRIEHCRFVKFPHGVALTGAPLSDIIACEFKDCDIGVRAIGKASPTIWGCRFEGGRLGALVMDGGPYIRNNLFHNLDEGLRIASGDLPIVRNNVFWKCKDHGIRLLSSKKPAIISASIRNCIFVKCGDAVSGPKDSLDTISHCVVHQSGEEPIQAEGGGSSFDLKARKVLEANAKLRLKGGTLTVGDSKITKGQGIRLSHQPVGEKGDIGLADGWDSPGCRKQKGLTLPPVRFEGPIFIVNSVAEEYVFAASEGCEVEMQGVDTKKGRTLDTLTVSCDGENRELMFDIDRCFAEIGLDL